MLKGHPLVEFDDARVSSAVLRFKPASLTAGLDQFGALDSHQVCEASLASDVAVGDALTQKLAYLSDRDLAGFTL
jgi:hypothetical protein